jgi:hypothetical protein
VPAFVGSLGSSGKAPGAESLTVLAGVFVLGLGATVAQLRYADNAQ